MPAFRKIKPATSKNKILFVHSKIDEYPLTLEQFRVYCHITRRDGKNGAWPAIVNIAAACHIHKDTARRCLQALVQYNLLSVTDKSKEGKANVYRLTDADSWMPAENVRALQEAKAQIGKAKRAAKMIAQAEARAAGKPPKKKSTRKQEGVVVNGGTGSTENEEGSGRREASETQGGAGEGHKGRPACEMQGAEVNPLSRSIEGNPKKRENAPVAPSLDTATEESFESNPTQANQETKILRDQETVEAIASELNAANLKKVPPGGETEAYLRAKLGPAFVDTLLEEAKLDGVSRRSTWFEIPLDRAQQLAVEAWEKREGQTTTKSTFRTLLKSLLDLEIGRAGKQTKFDQKNWED